MGTKKDASAPKPKPVQFGKPISGGKGAYCLVPKPRAKPKGKR